MQTEQIQEPIVLARLISTGKNRVQFYTFNKTTTEDGYSRASRVYVPAVYYRDFYAEQIAQEAEPDYAGPKFFTTEFNSPGDYSWVCPDTRNITISDDPYNYRDGVSFVMVVN